MSNFGRGQDKNVGTIERFDQLRCFFLKLGQQFKKCLKIFLLLNLSATLLVVSAILDSGILWGTFVGFFFKSRPVVQTMFKDFSIFSFDCHFEQTS